jgi:hypothetical protein
MHQNSGGHAFSHPIWVFAMGFYRLQLGVSGFFDDSLNEYAQK